ncbi:MAG: hypothetical protein K6T68_05420 [Alicyclobacillus shizuokensis]|nr:hypothetical protein [Alicyclobacillus shizuokensis]
MEEIKRVDGMSAESEQGIKISTHVGHKFDECLVDCPLEFFSDVILYPWKGGIHVDGVFGGFTRWAVVFLIIFVLFILLIPHHVGYQTTCTTTPVY